MSDCCICLEILDKDNEIVSLDCKHMFHYNCLVNVKNNKCPLCRKEISDKPICAGNHIQMFHASFFKKKTGKCRHCGSFSFKKILKDKIII